MNKLLLVLSLSTLCFPVLAESLQPDRPQSYNCPGLELNPMNPMRPSDEIALRDSTPDGWKKHVSTKEELGLILPSIRTIDTSDVKTVAVYLLVAWFLYPLA